jgi:lactoylglutathione lyase
MSAEFEGFGPPVLFVEDLAKSQAFYVETLGLRLAFGDETGAGLFLGDEMFLLTTVDSAADMLPGEDVSSLRSQRPAGLFNIFVENTDDAFELLRSKGVEFIVEPMDRPWGRRTAHFKDPDGVIWEISQSID